MEVKRLWRVGSILVVLLLALTVAKFLLAGQWLYSRLAERDIMMLNEKDLLRSSTVCLTCGVRVWGLGFWVFGFGVLDLGCRVSGFGFGVSGCGLGFGFRVEDLGSRI